MENHECKLCCRSFANGKALGGHMRSHKMNSSSSSSSEEEKSGLSSPFLSHETETDSSKKHQISMVGTSRISRRFFFEEEKVSFLDPESLSLSSTVSDEDDAAHCLIMLSRDKRKKDEIKYQIQEKLEDYDYSKNKVRAKLYRCEICSKLFRSFQALGGHRAGHNKIKVNTRDSSGISSGGPKSAAAAALERTVACPFCPRVFTSGQAFGGHKRTHFIAATAKSSFSRNGECFDIDLNLPASFDEEMQN